MIRWCLLLFLILLPVVNVVAAESPVLRIVYVDSEKGDDARDGAAPLAAGGAHGPLLTIKRALQVASPGATIQLASGQEFHETVLVEGYNLGTAASPLVIDGNGATLSGLVEIPRTDWKRDDNGRYYVDAGILQRFAPQGAMPKSNWLWHWKRQEWWRETEAPGVLFINGNAAAQAESAEKLTPGSWFYNVNAQPLRIWFMPPEGNAPVHLSVAANRGVILNDDYVVVRNLASQYSSDDGFSTFLAASAVFENIYGANNCDQGISLHNYTAGVVVGSLFERNGGCGIVDVMSTQSVYIQTTVRNNMVSGAWLAGSSHTLQSCLFVDNRGAQLTVCSGTRANLVNCLIRGKDEINAMQPGIEVQGDVRIDHCTIADCAPGVNISSASQALTVCTNSIFLRCQNGYIRAPEAQKLSIAQCLFAVDGGISIGNKLLSLSDPAWAEKPLDRLLRGSFVAPVELPDLFAGLANAHPLNAAGTNRTPLGAQQLQVRLRWQPAKPVEIIPVTIYTHKVGRVR